MYDTNIPSCLETVLISKPGQEEYERSLDELVDGLTDPRSEYNILEQKLKRDLILYMITSHGHKKRRTGGLYSRHPYGVARDTLKGPKFINNNNYTGTDDFEIIISDLLHDIIEENVDEKIVEYLNSRLGFGRNIPIYNKVANSIIKKTKNYKLHLEIFHNKEILKLKENLTGLLENYAPDNIQIKEKIDDTCSIINVLTRKQGDNYYNVIGQILTSNISWENKIIAVLVKLNDRINNNKTMNPTKKDEPKNFFAKIRQDIANYMRSKETSVKELDSMYYRNEHFDLFLARTKNRISHFFQDFGPYKNIDKVYASYKNMIIMLQVRAFQKEIQELIDNQVILKNYLTYYISKHENFKKKELSYFDNRKGLIELHKGLQENKTLCEDIINLKKHLNEHKIYFSNRKVVTNLTKKLSKQDFFKSNINDISLYLLSEYANVISDKYNLKLNENINKLGRIYHYLDKYQINETIDVLSKSNVNSNMNSLGYLKRYFIHPKKIKQINSSINIYDRIDEITVAKKLGGNIFDGYIHRELDNRIKKTPGYFLYKIKSGINKISESRTTIVLRKISELFNKDSGYVLRGLSFTGLEPYGWGVKLDDNGLLNSCEIPEK